MLPVFITSNAVLIASQRERPWASCVGEAALVTLLSMLDWNRCPEVERIPGKMSGPWLFKNTRVPVSTLFENLKSGATVERFLEWFEGVARAQIDAVLDCAEASLAAA
jgi:uncharacterized protein (DUF433 family)